MVEVGCGCAETAQVLLKEYADQCTQWVGLMISPVQVHIADTRLQETQKLLPKMDSKYRIFTADAAKPKSWSSEIQDSVRSSSSDSDLWLVALDTLVDFRPSRKEVLSYARNELGASVAITDHLKKEDMTGLDSAKTWASFQLLDTPLNSILTRRQYIELLVECGFKRENISIVPYTEHVYAPYSRFIEQQGRRWQEMGGSNCDYMDFTLAGWVTGWWARSGLVEACMIVARR